jgi:hypothetical protein
MLDSVGADARTTRPATTHCQHEVGITRNDMPFCAGPFGRQVNIRCGAFCAVLVDRIPLRELSWGRDAGAILFIGHVTDSSVMRG